MEASSARLLNPNPVWSQPIALCRINKAAKNEILIQLYDTTRAAKPKAKMISFDVRAMAICTRRAHCPARSPHADHPLLLDADADEHGYQHCPWQVAESP